MAQQKRQKADTASKTGKTARQKPAMENGSGKSRLRRQPANECPYNERLYIDERSQGPDTALSSRYAELTHTLLAWFYKQKRDLPWRKTYDPYHVLVSEFMLQQTQVSRAAEYFERWVARFPTLADVARAHPDDALKAWEGLGYYSRVKNLCKSAAAIMERHGGTVPCSYEALVALPGIGEYTAGAVMSIAFNKPYPAVDANVERVFARLFDVAAPVKSPPAAGFIRHMAESLIPEGKARDYNEALMEFGALVCGKKTLCEACPLAAFCQAKHLGITHERPIPGKKVPYSALQIVAGVLIHKGRVFLQKRLDTGVWAGFWEFPGGRLEEGERPEQGVVREMFEETGFKAEAVKHLGLVRHAYTRYKIAMHCFALELSSPRPANKGLAAGVHSCPEPVLTAATEYRWVLPEELADFTLPAGHRKLADERLDDIIAIAGHTARKK